MECSPDCEKRGHDYVCKLALKCEKCGCRMERSTRHTLTCPYNLLSKGRASYPPRSSNMVNASKRVANKGILIDPRRQEYCREVRDLCHDACKMLLNDPTVNPKVIRWAVQDALCTYRYHRLVHRDYFVRPGPYHVVQRDYFNVPTWSVLYGHANMILLDDHTSSLLMKFPPTCRENGIVQPDLWSPELDFDRRPWACMDSGASFRFRHVFQWYNWFQ